MKYVWLVVVRDGIDDIQVFKSLDDAHNYANTQISMLRAEGFESEIEGLCFSKEKLRKDHFMHISLEREKDIVKISIERRKVE